MGDKTPKAAEKRSPEKKAAEKKSPEKKAVEKKTPEKKVVEKGQDTDTGEIKVGKADSRLSSPSTTSNNNQKSSPVPKVKNVPLEMAKAADPEKPAKKGFFKKLFMKIGEKMGTVKQTEFSKEYMDAVNSVDEYYIVVEELNKVCCQMLQQNRKHLSKLENMYCQSPVGKDPYEELCRSLKPFIPEIPYPEGITAARESAKWLAKYHREMQEDVRKATHFFRTFVNQDYPNFEDERRKLLTVRQTLDHARYEYEGNPNDNKKHQFELAEQQFTQQIDKILGMVQSFEKRKADHISDLVLAMRALHKYHHKSMLECDTLQKHRAKLGEPTQLDW